MTLASPAAVSNSGLKSLEAITAAIYRRTPCMDHEFAGGNAPQDKAVVKSNIETLDFTFGTSGTVVAAQHFPGGIPGNSGVHRDRRCGLDANYLTGIHCILPEEQVTQDFRAPSKAISQNQETNENLYCALQHTYCDAKVNSSRDLWNCSRWCGA